MIRLALSVLVLAGCRSSRLEPPGVQSSSTAAPDTNVKITTKFEFAPACTVVRAGQTIEWWVDPEAAPAPVNVTSLGRPVELYSPNLVLPVGPCATQQDPGPPLRSARLCWRHTFARAGCFPYYDTNSGSPGRPVVDDYYGTITYVGESTGAQKGLVCVEGPGVSCAGVCCNSNIDCPKDFTCDRGRCVSVTDRQPSPCPARPTDMSP